MNLLEIFEEQLKNKSPIPKEVYDKMEYKRSTFNNLFNIGDRVLYAYILKDNNNPNSLGLVQFSDSEMEHFKGKTYVGDHELDGLPIFKD